MLFHPLLISLALQASSVNADALRRRSSQLSPLADGTFDYVVVGGGTGGNAIATRLAQNSFKVALVEAGGHYEVQSLAAVPAADVLPVGSNPDTSSAVDWGFVTKDQPGANGRSIHYARGKCLGGSWVSETGILNSINADSFKVCPEFHDLSTVCPLINYLQSIQS